MYLLVLRKSPKDLQSNTHWSESEYPQEEERAAEAAVETV
jgi:hypothetical protein